VDSAQKPLVLIIHYASAFAENEAISTKAESR
jgi:hypothetical protein